MPTGKERKVLRGIYLTLILSDLKLRLNYNSFNNSFSFKIKKKIKINSTVQKNEVQYNIIKSEFQSIKHSDHTAQEMFFKNAS